MSGPVGRPGGVKLADNPDDTFDDHDLLALQRHRHRLTDDPIPLVAVSRSGMSCSGLAAEFGPADLLAAWKRRSGT